MWLGRGREDSKKSEFNVSLRTMSGGFQRQRRAVRKITATLTPTCAAFYNVREQGAVMEEP